MGVYIEDQAGKTKLERVLAHSKGKLYIAHPGAGRTYHIFDPEDRDRSLCGRYILSRLPAGLMMFFKDPERCELVRGGVSWVEGQDCKVCWRKAGLLEGS